MNTERTRFAAPSRKQLLLLAMSAGLLLSGCAVTPKPFSQEEIASINHSDRIAARGNMPAIESAISLEEAIARALKYNLDHRIRMLEQAHANGILEAGRYDMLPKLMANAGYAWRDEDNTRRATDSVTGLPSLANPYISSDRSHNTADIGLTWNLLDFGASYYTAKQNADRLLIANERRRKAMHALIQNVRTVFWRAMAAEKLSEQVRVTIQQAEMALTDSRQAYSEMIKSPGESLRYQRNVLENLRLLENVQRELSAARIELASLIGVDPGKQIALVEPGVMQPMPLNLSVQSMEETALTKNADLREHFYSARIAATDTRKALLKLLPGLSFNYGYNYDNDKYLINDQWRDAGMRVSFNLFNLLSGPSQMKAAEMNATVAQARRMALQMSVLTQVHLARHQYDDALRQFQRADTIHDVDTRLAKLAQNQEQSQMASRLDRISSNVTSILSSVRRYQAMAKVHEAASRVQSIMGMEPEIGSLDDTDLPTLQKQIDQSLQRWAQIEMSIPQIQPAPVSVAFSAGTELVATKEIVPPANPQAPAVAPAKSSVDVASAASVAAALSPLGADAAPSAKTRPANAIKNAAGLSSAHQKIHLTQTQPLKLALDIGK